MTDRRPTNPMLRPPPKDRREALETLRLLVQQGRVRLPTRGVGQ
jgi:hypothetical protein